MGNYICISFIQLSILIDLALYRLTEVLQFWGLILQISQNLSPSAAPSPRFLDGICGFRSSDIVGTTLLCGLA